MSLKEKIEEFINRNFNFYQNEIFEIELTFLNNFPIIYDDTGFLYVILDKKIDLKNKKEKDLKVKIINSHFDILIFKNLKNGISNIKFNFICIIKELKIIEEKEKNIFANYLNIYKFDSITNNFKKFIFSYIKEKVDDNRYKNIFPHWILTPEMIKKKIIPKCNFTLENILLGNDSINQTIKIININNEKIHLFNLMDYINNINEVISPIEIDPLKVNNEIFNDENKFKEIFLNTFEIQVKENFNENKNLIDLKEKLIDEIPENIKSIIEKYEGFKFNKKMFDDYYNKKLVQSNNNNFMNNEEEVEIKTEKTNNKNEINFNENNEINTNPKKKRKKKFFKTFINK